MTLYDNKLEPDIDAAVYIPEDQPEINDLFPCQVHSNGNCLPSCGSIFAYGHTDNTAELLVRIILELVLKEEKYLDDKSLCLGI